MSLRTTQQIDKLIVGQIYPRDINNAPITSGLTLITDSQGRAVWTTLSTVTNPYIQFTALSTSQGGIVATTNNSVLNLRDGGGMNLQIISNALYLNTTNFLAVDISGGNSLLSSNSSNNNYNPRLKFATGSNVSIRGDPGTNTVFFDVKNLNVVPGDRAKYTTFIINNNSTYTQPPTSQQVVLDAFLSDSSITLVGIGDVQLSVPNLNTPANTIYIGMSTITADRFSTLAGNTNAQLINISTLLDVVDKRQINTSGLEAGQFYPLSIAFISFSTSFSQNFISNQFNPVSTATGNINSAFQNELNTSTNIVSGNLTVAGNTILNTVTANYIIGDGSQISNLTGAGVPYPTFEPISTIAVYTSTTVSQNFSTLSSYIKNIPLTLPPNLSTNWLSTGLLTAKYISVSVISTTYGFFSTISAGSIYGKFVGDGSLLKNLPSASDLVSTGFLTASNISTNTLSTNYGFFSTISAGSIYATFVGDGSQLSNLSIVNGLAALPPILSTTLLSTGLLTASNVSTNTQSTNYGFFSTISAGTIYATFVGDGSLLTNVPFNANGISIVPAILSTTLLSTGLLTASNVSTNTQSTNYGFFSTVSAGSIYAKFFGDGSQLCNLPTVTGFDGISNSVIFLLGVSNLSATTLSTSYGFFSTISAVTVYGKHIGDGSLLTNVPFNANGISIVPAILSTTLLSTGVLTASNISTISFTANTGLFSTISSGQINGKFVGDGSGLINIPGTITTNQITTVSATGSDQTLVVPSGVTSVLVILKGAGGGASAVGTAGGAGGLVSGIITTTPGETLTFVVGKAGTTGTNSTTVAGGYGGGGSTVSTQGGTGGGRTAVKRIVSAVLTEVITAGGGGGGGGTNEVGGNGGGPPSTFPGIAGGSGGVGNGKGGTSTAGGVGGTTNGGSSLTGGNTISGSGTYSGAGGGGYYGGGGGTNNPNSGGAGGGGGGFALASIQNILGASGGGSVSSTDGSITIYYNTVSIGADTIEANTGYFSTVIANTFIGKYLGDGSALTGIVPTDISVNTISSAYGFFSTLSANTVYAKFVGDGSGLTNVPGGGGGGISVIPSILSTTLLSTGLLTASNVSTNVLSTNYGFFSTISAGKIFARFVGDGSQLSNLPGGGGWVQTATSYLDMAMYDVSNAGTVNASYFKGDGSQLINLPGGGGGGGISIVPPVLSTTLLSTGLLTASNVSTNTQSTNYGFFSTISANTIYSKFVGDGSLLTNIPNNGAVQTLSNSINTINNNLNFLQTVSNTSAFTVSTTYGFFSTLSAGNITVEQGNFSSIVATQSYISSLFVDSLTIGFSTGYIAMTDVFTTSLSSLAINTGYLNATTAQFSSLSSSAIYGSFIGDGSRLINVPGGGGWVQTATSYLNMATFNISNAGTVNASYFIGDGSGLTNVGGGGGGISIVPPILSTTLLSTGLLTASNISTNVISTNYGFFSTISAGKIFARFVGDGSGLSNVPGGGGWVQTATSYLNMATYDISNAGTVNASYFKGDGSQLTNLPGGGGGGISIVPPILSTTLLSTGLLTASNVSTNTQSTNYGFFSTISANTVYAKFVGDGSSLTNIPNNGAVFTVSNDGVTTSNNLTTVSNSATTISNNLTTVSNSATTISNSVNTVSNTVNFLLNVSNISALTMSTTYGFFSTLSAGNVTVEQGNFSSIVATQSYISSLFVDSLTIGFSTGYIAMTDVFTTSLSSLAINTGYLNATTAQFSSLSSSAIYGSFIGDGSRLINVPGGGGWVQTATSYLNMATFNISNAGTVNASYFIGDGSGLTNVGGGGGGISIVPAILSTTLLSTGLLTASNISTNAVSTNYGFFSTISAGKIFARFVGDGSQLSNLPGGGGWVSTATSYLNMATYDISNAGTVNASYFKGDGSQLTNLPGGGGGISIVPPILSTTLLSTGLLTASNISTGTISTSYGFFSTISANTVYAKFVGDGSSLTNIPNNGAVFTVSNDGVTTSNNLTTVSNSANTISNNLTTVSNSATTISNSVNTVSNTVNFLLTVSNISAFTVSTTYGFFSTLSAGNITVEQGNFSSIVATQSYISSLFVDSLTIGFSTGYIAMTDVFTTSLSSLAINTGYLNATTAQFSSLSSSAIYGSFIGDGSRLINVPGGGGWTQTATSYLNMATFNISNAGTVNASYFIGDGSGLTNVGGGGGGISIVPAILSTTLLSTGLLTASNISTNAVSTNYGFFSTISAGKIFARFVGDGSQLSNLPGGGGWVSTATSYLNMATYDISNAGTVNASYFKGDGSQLTNLPGGGGGISIVPPILSTTLLSTGLLTASTISTTYGFFSTILANIVYAKFVGDGSGLTNIPNNGAVLAVSNAGVTTSNNLTTVSTILNAVSTQSATNNTNIGIQSNLLSDVSTNLTTLSTIVDSLSFELGTVDGNLDTVSNRVDTVSNRVNFLLNVSNISAFTLSTTYGFFSTLSAGNITVTQGNFSSIVATQSYISSLFVDSLTIGFSTGYIAMTDVFATSLSSLVVNTGYLNVTSAQFSSLSSSAIYGSFIGDGSRLTNLNGGGGGGISIVPPILSTTLLSTGLLTACNISTYSISTTYGFFSTISANTVYAKFVGDGSGLTNIPNNGAVLAVSNIGVTISNNLTTVSNRVDFLLNVSTISAFTTSTTYGFFSTLSANTVYAKFVGDGSSLTNIPNNGAVLAVSNIVVTTSNNLTTVSNRVDFLLNVSNISTFTTSTTYGFFSTISANTVYAKFVGDGSQLSNLSVTGISIVPPILSTTLLSTGLLTACNISTYSISTTYGFFSTLSANTVYAKFVGDGSSLTNIPNNGAVLAVSNIGVTTSNRVDFLLNVSNISAFTTSTTYGFFSTLSANTVYAKFVGDGSSLTNIPNNGAVLAVSNIGVTTSNNLTTASNRVDFLLNVSNISAFTTSTTYGFFSTLSANTVYAKFVGDGSSLTNIPNNGAVLAVSNIGVTTSNRVDFLLNVSNISAFTTSTTYGFFSTLSAGNVTVEQGNFSSIVATQSYISSLFVDSLTIGFSTGYIAMTDVFTTSLSSLVVNTGYLNATTAQFSSLSSSAIYGSFIGDGSRLTNVPGGGGWVQTATSYLNMATFNISNAGTVNANYFIGDGSGLTNVGGGGGGISIVPPILSTTLLSTGLLTANSVSTSQGIFSSLVVKNSYISSLIVDSLTLGLYNGYISMTDVITSTLSSVIINTGYLNATTAQFSSLSTATIYGKFIGDGSDLLNLPGGGGGISVVPPELSTTFLSTGLLTASSISTNDISTNYGFFSTISANTVYAQFFGDGSQLSGINSSFSIPENVSANTLSTNLLTACNVSTDTLSTNYGYFSTISANTIYGKFYGDGSDITNITGGWIPTATSDLNMANYSISNLSSIYNQTGGNLSININKGETDVSLAINMNGMSFSITADGITGDITFTNANSSNLILSLGGQTGTISVGSDTNLYWNDSRIWTDANQAPIP